MKKLLLFFITAVLLSSNAAQGAVKAPAGRWSAERANAWYAKQPWLVGSDYIPSTAINQLEMWQAETFDTATIAKEMKLSASLGMNTHRVFLHHLAWQADPKGFKARINTFLNITSRYGIRPIFVIFDDCWNPYPKIGKQPQPIPHTHNSGWVQDPGMDAHNDWAKAMPTLEKYVKDILTTFGKDNRILMWDLYNEPGNQGPVNKTAPRFPAYGNKSMPLVKNAFKWAREVNPSQPLTMGIWNLDLTELNQYQTAHSDVITYHNYSEKADHEKNIKYLQLFNRPIVCTEYMSRGSNSTFGEILPILKKYHVGAINWGFVSGKTQTIYPWDSWEKDYTTEPELWFHDIFRKDLTPYKEGEVQLIRDLTGKNNIQP